MKHIRRSAFFILTLGIFSSPVFAEDMALKPLGVRLGSFLLHPALSIEESYDDNIFKNSSNEQSDFITRFKPAMSIASDWDLHAVELLADGEIARYADHKTEDVKDYTVAARGRYDLDYKTFVDGQIGFSRAHEKRGSPDDPGGDEPAAYDVMRGEVGFTRALGSLHLFMKGRIVDFDYKDTSVDGVSVSNNERDRIRREGDIKFAYALGPKTQVFARGVWDQRDYDDRNAAADGDRSSHGRRINGGATFAFTGKTSAEIYGGHIARDYGAAFKDISTVDYGGALHWEASALSTVSAGLKRSVIETTQSGVPAYIRNDWSLDGAHRFTDQIMFSAMMGYMLDNFIGSTRADDTIKATIELGYTPQRGLDSFVRYRYLDRDSTLNNAVYTNHSVTAGIGYRF